MSEARIISDKTGISIALFALLSAALVMVGVYIQKVDTLVGQMHAVQADLTAIRVRLGIPPGREPVVGFQVEGTAPPLSVAIERLLRRRQPAPWQEVVVRE